MGAVHRLSVGGHSIVEPFPRHRGGPIQQVADGVRQVVIDQIDEALLLKITVIAELNVPQQVPTHRIGSTALEQQLGVENIAQGFTHLLSFTGEEAMAKNHLR